MAVSSPLKISLLPALALSGSRRVLVGGYHDHCPSTFSSATYFRPLGLHHFHDAFSLEGKANLRQDALAQFRLVEAELTSDLRLAVSAAKKWQSVFLTNGRMALNSAPSSSVNSFSEADALTARRANWSSFTEAADNRPRSPAEMGVNFSSTLSPHPKHSRSGAILV